MAVKNKVQLITYPDSLGGDLKALGRIMSKYFTDVFAGGVHILPPFPSSGDRGFAPKTYLEIEPSFGDWEDIKAIGEQFDVVVDMMVNHISKESTYFKDFLDKGKSSPYADYFITLDKIWKDGQPVQADIDKIFLRRKQPYSTFTAAGEEVKVWTTFGATDPSQQIDLDVHANPVREMFTKIFQNFSQNNIKMVRLDAVGYVIKKLGTSCFFVEPDIFDFLHWIWSTAQSFGIELLPEIHAKEEIQQSLSQRDYWIYDFILPYRTLEMLLCKTSGAMKTYLKKRSPRQFTTLDCHDGVPIKPDLDGFYDPEQAKQVVEHCLKNGCHVSRILSDAHKDADGFDVHQICGSYFSMVGYNTKAYLAARAVQLFVPGIPQVYYVGALAGENHPERLEQTGDRREINRYNYSEAEIAARMETPIVQRLCAMMRFRNGCDCFDGSFTCLDCGDDQLLLRWTNGEESCQLFLDLNSYELEISHCKNGTKSII